MLDEKMTVDLDSALASVLRQAGAAAGTTPEAPIARADETGLKHRVPVERMEALEAEIAAIARFVEKATALGDGGIIDVERL